MVYDIVVLAQARIGGGIEGLGGNKQEGDAEEVNATFLLQLQGFLFLSMVTSQYTRNFFVCCSDHPLQERRQRDNNARNHQI